jgi:type I restriction enzyme M protein
LGAYCRVLLLDRYARRVGLAEIEQNGYNLNISRYVSTSTDEEVIDLKTVHQQLLKIEERASKFRNMHNQCLQELGLPLL